MMVVHVVVMMMIVMMMVHVMMVRVGFCRDGSESSDVKAYGCGEDSFHGVFMVQKHEARVVNPQLRALSRNPKVGSGASPKTTVFASAAWWSGGVVTVNAQFRKGREVRLK